MINAGPVGIPFPILQAPHVSSVRQAVSSTRGASNGPAAVQRHARQRQSGAAGQRRVTVRPPRVVRIKRILQKEPETRLGFMTFDGCCG